MADEQHEQQRRKKRTFPKSVDDAVQGAVADAAKELGAQAAAEHAAAHAAAHEDVVTAFLKADQGSLSALTVLSVVGDLLGVSGSPEAIEKRIRELREAATTTPGLLSRIATRLEVDRLAGDVDDLVGAILDRADELVEFERKNIAQAALGNVLPTQRLDEVTVTWGDEKFSDGDYGSFTAGAVFYKTRVDPGEDPEKAAERAYGVTEAVGERFRSRKQASYLRARGELRAALRAQG